MTNSHGGGVTERRPLRLWPGVALVIFQWALTYAVPPFTHGIEIFDLPFGLIALLAGVAAGVGIVIWWLFFSRAPWTDRLAAVALMAVGVLVMTRLVDISIAGAGQGRLLYIAAIPGLCLALVSWAALTRSLSDGLRRAALVAAVVLACLPWTLVRTAGIVGGAGAEYHWRWTATPEQQLLARGAEELKPLPPATDPAPAAPAPMTPADRDTQPASRAEAANSKRPAAATATAKPAGPAATVREPAPVESKDKRVEAAAEWPGFRGPRRDGVIRGVSFETDWSKSPPVELWRRPIGPGWSSFAVLGDLLYTQEQRGEDEIVACYRVSTGEPVWRHADPARFYESNGGAGPRGTPALHNGRVYAFGATGILNALDARTGKVVWSRNVATDTGRRVPDWGFASSPLVVDDNIVVAAAGTLAAYDLASGEPRWRGPKYGGSYSSPHRATIDGVDQIVLLGGPGAISVAAKDGAPLWEHKWSPGAIVQPGLTSDGILINAIAGTGGLGTRRLVVSHDDGGWNVEERWTSTGLKPYFNDFVVHAGHAYGFDGSILSCIDLETGARKWKGGRYGNGQLVLLPDQDLLLVLSEDGELALVSATTDQYKEIARVPALEGKTWNHPVIVGDVLLTRNGQEMAAFRLTPRTADGR